MISTLESSAPLKVARPFPRDDGGLDVCVMDASPGLLCGDKYGFSWHLEANTIAQITTQGFTRVHPARAGNSDSRLETQIYLEENATLLFLPDPILPFLGARLRSEMHAKIAAGARLVLLESLCAGRIARGEVWSFGAIRSRTLVEDERGPLFCAQQKIEPSASLSPPSPLSPRNFLAFGDWTHSAVLFFAGDFAPETESVSRETAARFCLLHSGENAISAAVSPLARRGFVVQMLARRGHEILELTRLLANAVSRETTKTEER